MNKIIVFLIVATSFQVCADWPDDFSFRVDGHMNYSCERHSIMSQISQEYKDNDCMSDEDVRKMAGLDSQVSSDDEILSSEQNFQKVSSVDSLESSDVHQKSLTVLCDEQKILRLKDVVIQALARACILKLYKINVEQAEKDNQD